MSTLGVHPRVAGPTSMSHRSQVFVPLAAVAIALTLMILGVTAATRRISTITLPQQRDMAPTRMVRDPETHALVWIPAHDTQPVTDYTSQQPLRPRYAGK